MGGVCGHQISRRGRQNHARIPVLRQAHGKTCCERAATCCRLSQACALLQCCSLTICVLWSFPLQTALSPYWFLLQRITYAKAKSDAIAKAEGTYIEKDKTARQKHNEEQRGKTALDTMACAYVSTCHIRSR